MTIFRHILCLGAAASVLVSCLSSVKPDGRREAITFEPVVGAEVRSENTSQFPEDVSLGIWAVMSEGQTFIEREPVTFDGEAWSTASPYYWPEGATLHFYGFAPYEYGMQMNAGGSLVLDAAAPALEAGGADIGPPVVAQPLLGDGGVALDLAVQQGGHQMELHRIGKGQDVPQVENALIREPRLRGVVRRPVQQHLPVPLHTDEIGVIVGDVGHRLMPAGPAREANVQHARGVGAADLDGGV